MCFVIKSNGWQWAIRGIESIASASFNDHAFNIAFNKIEMQTVKLFHTLACKMGLQNLKKEAQLSKLSIKINFQNFEKC